jgi:ketosteroid isomerase-like protein
MSDKESIEKLRHDYEVALNEGDIKSLMSTLTSDIVTLPPGFPAVFGEETESWIKQNFLDPFDIDFKSEDDEVVVIHDHAFTRGHYTQTLTPKPGGDTMNLVGKYLCIVRRESDGAWRYSHLSWNTDSL